MRAYAELHCLSNFTFLRGASHPEELVETATKLGYEALAITDECSVSGIVRAHMAAKESSLKKLIVGAEFRLESALKLVVLVQSRAGYGALCQLITRGRRAAKKGSYKLTEDDFLDSTEEWRPRHERRRAAVSAEGWRSLWPHSRSNNGLASYWRTAFSHGCCRYLHAGRNVGNAGYAERARRGFFFARAGSAVLDC